MSNHIANSVNCDPEISSSAMSTTVPTLTWLPATRKTELHESEHEAGDAREQAEGVEEDERVEVADDVLLAQPPEEPAQQQPRDARHDASGT